MKKMHRQFDPSPLVCPHCHNVIGEIAYFESFEYRVAGWLNGQVAPNSTPGFDVWKCKDFPDLTFQVKYSMSKVFKTKYQHVDAMFWAWVVKNPQPNSPDFFILFGIHPDGSEHVILLSRADFYAKSWITKSGTNKDARQVRVSAKDKSERKNYNYIPKIRRYEVFNPATDLVGHIKKYIANPAYMPNAIIRSEVTSVFTEEVIPEIHRLYAYGYRYTDIAKIYGKKPSFIGKIIRRSREQYAYIYDLPLFSHPTIL